MSQSVARRNTKEKWCHREICTLVIPELVLSHPTDWRAAAFPEKECLQGHRAFWVWCSLWNRCVKRAADQQPQSWKRYVPHPWLWQSSDAAAAEERRELWEKGDPGPKLSQETCWPGPVCFASLDLSIFFWKWEKAQSVPTSSGACRIGWGNDVRCGAGAVRSERCWCRSYSCYCILTMCWSMSGHWRFSCASVVEILGFHAPRISLRVTVSHGEGKGIYRAVRFFIAS